MLAECTVQFATLRVRAHRTPLGVLYGRFVALCCRTFQTVRLHNTFQCNFRYVMNLHRNLRPGFARLFECAQICTSFDAPLDINPDKTLTYRSDV